MSGPVVPPITSGFLQMAASYHSAVRWGFQRGLLTLRADAGHEAYQFVRQNYGIAMSDSEVAAARLKIPDRGGAGIA